MTEKLAGIVMFRRNLPFWEVWFGEDETDDDSILIATVLMSVADDAAFRKAYADLMSTRILEAIRQHASENNLPGTFHFGPREPLDKP